MRIAAEQEQVRSLYAATIPVLEQLPLVPEDVERFRCHVRDIQIVILEEEGPETIDWPVQTEEVNGRLVLKRQSALIDIPPVLRGERQVILPPLLTLLPQDGELQVFRVLHEWAHLLSCGVYSGCGNDIIHRNGSLSMTYAVEEGKVTLKHREGSIAGNEVLTDLTALYMYGGLYPYAPKPVRCIQPRQSAMLEALHTRGIALEVLAADYLTDRETSKAACRRLVESVFR